MAQKRIYNKAYKNFRTIVLKRDKYKCQMPGCKNKSKLEVHHILPYSMHFDIQQNIENALTLCRFCHRKIKNKEYNFVHLFRTILKNKKK